MDVVLREQAERQATLCRIFGNTSRILILWTLAGGELSVHEIAGEVETSLQNISQHLALLKKHEIVVARREGRTIYYRLADKEWIHALPILLKTPQHHLVEE